MSTRRVYGIQDETALLAGNTIHQVYGIQDETDLLAGNSTPQVYEIQDATDLLAGNSTHQVYYEVQDATDRLAGKWCGGENGAFDQGNQGKSEESEAGDPICRPSTP